MSTDRWDASGPLPRDLIIARGQIESMWLEWLDGGSPDEMVRDRHGRSAGYHRTPGIAGYAYEATVAWDYNLLDGSTSRIAEGFWCWMQERHAAMLKSLDYVMTEQEAENFRFWNTTIAARRTYSHVTLPWNEGNARAITTGRAEAWWGEGSPMLDHVQADVRKFWAWNLSYNSPEPYVPADPDGPLDVRDPRVRHLWIAAANVARSQGMCGSYDKIATEVGVPDRSQLRRTGELKTQIKITFMLQVSQIWDRDAAHPDYSTIDSEMTGADFRKMLANKTDEELRSMFSVYQQAVLE